MQMRLSMYTLASKSSQPQKASTANHSHSSVAMLRRIVWYQVVIHLTGLFGEVANHKHSRETVLCV
jgi:hypothetical protein